MNIKTAWMFPVLIGACLGLPSCRKMEVAEETETSPATVEHVDGDGPAKVTLTADAAKRLDVQTTPIQESSVNGTPQKVMPYAALLYDTEGNTWAFVNLQELTYVREPVKVNRIDGDNVLLAEGPASGTKVVTVGVAELYGSEIEFEEE
jgi:hypothetical protein